MKRAYLGMLSALLALLVFGCSPSPGGEARQMQTRGTSDPYTLGNNKGSFTNFVASDPIADAEWRIRRIPGILDAQIVTFRNTIIVGALTDGRTVDADRRVHFDSPYNAKRPEERIRPVPYSFHNRIIRAIRPGLHPKSRYQVLLIATDQISYARIADIKRRMQAGEPVSGDEFNRLMNDIGFYREPLNLAD